MLTTEALMKWCRSTLGSGVAKTLFERGNLSQVFGVRLEDEREVVIKIRPWQNRLQGCAAVQRHLSLCGYPCPPLVTDLDQIGDWAIHAEALLAGGEQRNPALGAATYAALLRQLLVAAPDAARVPTLLPSPPWTAWDHPAATTWPERDDRGLNLNAFDGPRWVDDAAQRVRETLNAYEAPLRVGHGDWESQNIQWTPNVNRPLAVHDWDSVIAQPEAAIVGFASAVWAAQGGPGEAATVAQTAEFIDAYEQECGGWSEQDRAAAWTAGLWVRLFNAKKDACEGGGPQLERLRGEIDARMHRAGLQP